MTRNITPGAARPGRGSAAVARARRVTAAAARRPAVSVPAVASLITVITVTVITGNLIAALITGAAVAPLALFLLVRFGVLQPEAMRIRVSHGRTSVKDRFNAEFGHLRPETDHPGPPGDSMDAALKIVNGILAAIKPGPEKVAALDPESRIVRWDHPGPSGQPGNLPAARADKMMMICGLVRGRAQQLGVLHQLPQVILVADDGATIEILGLHGMGRIGTARKPGQQ
jgi:hypothetical protein